MDDNLGPAWRRVAVALSGPEPAGAGHEAEAEDEAREVPPGWESLAEVLRPTAGPVEAPAGPEPATVPAGWQALAGALHPPRPATAAPPAPGGAPDADGPVAPETEAAAPEVGLVAPGPEVPEPGGSARRASGVRRVAASRNGRIGAAVVAAAVVAAVVVLVVIPSGGSGGGRVPAGDVFRVDGRATTLASYNAEVKVLEELYGVKAPSKSDASKYATFQQTTAKALAAQVLFGRIASKKGISVPAKQASDTLDTVVQDDYSGSQSDFDSALTSAGLTRSEVLTQVTDQLLQDQLFDKVVGTPKVTSSEERAIYAQDSSTLGTAQTRAISYIVVKSKTTASSILAKLRHGASFATLAKADSLDTSTKSKGGSLGTLTKADLASAFGDAAFAAALDKPFGPVSDGGGYYDVGEVTKITPASSPSYDAATQKAIREYLVDKADVRRWDTWLRGQLTKADITYAAGYRPADPDTPPTISVPSVATFLADESSSSTTSPAPSTP